MRQLAEIALVAVFWGICSRLSPERAGDLGAWFMARIGRFSSRNEVARRNLCVAFPDRDAAGIERLRRQMWANLGIVLGEYPHLATICRAGSDRIEVVPHPALDLSRPTVFCGPHLTSWEVAAAGPVRLGLSLTVVYRPLSVPLIDRWLKAARTGLGVRLLPSDGSGVALMRELKRGNSIGLVADARDSFGTYVQFFGYRRRVPPAPALLALKAGAQFASARVERLAKARYRVFLDAPIVPEDDSADLEARAGSMMRQLHARYEAYIRVQPGNWLCVKKAWAKHVIERGLAVSEGAVAGPRQASSQA